MPTEHLHTFTTSIDLTPAIERATQRAAREAAASVKKSDESFSAGLQASEKMAAPTSDALLLLAASAAAKDAKAGLKPTPQTKKDLQKVRTAIKKSGGIKIMRSDGSINSEATKKMADYLKSPKYYDLRKRATVSSLHWYLKHSKNDILRNLNFRRISSRDVDRLIRKKDKLGLSDTDLAALRLLRKQKKQADLARRFSAQRGFIRAKALAKAASALPAANEDFGRGAQITAAIAATSTQGVAFTTRSAIYLNRAWKKHGLLGRQVAKTEQKVLTQAKKGTRYVVRTAGRGLRAAGKMSARALSIPAGKIRTSAKNAAASLARTSAGQTLSGGINAAVTAAKTNMKAARALAASIAQSKAAKRAAIAARRAGKIGKTAVGVSLLPYRAGCKILGALSRLFTGIRKWLWLSLGLILALYAVLLIFCSSYMNMVEEQRTAEETVILADSDDFVRKMAVSLIARSEAALTAARAVGETYDAYTLRVVDSSGRVLPISTNNAKDILCAAYVILGGEEAFTEEPAARDACISDLWELMNPEPEYEESEVYYCDEEDCPGHQDVSITLTVLFLEDLEKMEQDALLSALNGSEYGACMEEFASNGGFAYPSDENDGILWASSLYSGDWIDLYGMEPDGRIATASTSLTAEEMAAILQNTDTTDAGGAALSFALSKVGCPYDQDYHFSLTEDIYDCSSLVYRAYRESGTDISNAGLYSAAEELRAAEMAGTVVSLTDLQPGDLLFYRTADAWSEGRYRGCGHVAIYAGQGKMVEAKGREWGVIVSPLRTSGLLAVSRP